MGTHGHVSDFAAGVPYDGFYRIQLWAEPKYRTSKLVKNKWILEEPMRLAIVCDMIEFENACDVCDGSWKYWDNCAVVALNAIGVSR